jgi:hypothetical protein
MPVYVSLTPQTGNPNLELRIINDLSATMSSWEKIALSTPPDYESKESFDSDVIALETQDPVYKTKCGHSCIVLISVDGESSTKSAHYYI